MSLLTFFPSLKPQPKTTSERTPVSFTPDHIVPCRLCYYNDGYGWCNKVYDFHLHHYGCIVGIIKISDKLLPNSHIARQKGGFIKRWRRPFVRDLIHYSFTPFFEFKS